MKQVFLFYKRNSEQQSGISSVEMYIMLHLPCESHLSNFIPLIFFFYPGLYLFTLLWHYLILKENLASMAGSLGAWLWFDVMRLSNSLRAITITSSAYWQTHSRYSVIVATLQALVAICATTIIRTPK